MQILKKYVLKSSWNSIKIQFPRAHHQRLIPGLGRCPWADGFCLLCTSYPLFALPITNSVAREKTELALASLVLPQMRNSFLGSLKK